MKTSYQYDSTKIIGSDPNGYHKNSDRVPFVSPTYNYSRTLDYLNQAHNLQIHHSHDNKFIDNHVPDLSFNRNPYISGTPLKSYAEYLSPAPRVYGTPPPPPPPVYYDPIPSDVYPDRDLYYHRAGDSPPLQVISVPVPPHLYHSHPWYQGLPMKISNQDHVLLDSYSNVPRQHCGICPHEEDFIQYRSNRYYKSYEEERDRVNKLLKGNLSKITEKSEELTQKDSTLKNGNEKPAKDEINKRNPFLLPKKEDFEIEKIHEEEEEYKGLDDFIPSKDNNFFEDKEKIFKLKKQFNPENEKTIYDRRNYKVSLDELRRFVDAQVKEIKQDCFQNGFNRLENKIAANRHIYY